QYFAAGCTSAASCSPTAGFRHGGSDPHPRSRGVPNRGSLLSRPGGQRWCGSHESTNNGSLVGRPLVSRTSRLPQVCALALRWRAGDEAYRRPPSLAHQNSGGDIVGTAGGGIAIAECEMQIADVGHETLDALDPRLFFTRSVCTLQKEYRRVTALPTDG